MPVQPTTLVAQEVQNKVRGGRDQAYASTMRWYLDRVADEFSSRPNRSSALLPSSGSSQAIIPQAEDTLRARKNAAHARIESVQSEMKIVASEAAASEHKLSRFFLSYMFRFQNLNHWTSFRFHVPIVPNRFSSWHGHAGIPNRGGALGELHWQFDTILKVTISLKFSW